LIDMAQEAVAHSFDSPWIECLGGGVITRCLAVEWASKGISVVNVAPSHVETDLNCEALAQPGFKEFLAKRVPTDGDAGPESVARMVAAIFCENIPFLAGETTSVDGGQRIAQ